MGEMLQEIKSYWSERAEGYSKVNQEELEGEQREKWIKVLKEKFPDQEPEEIKVLDIGTGPGFFAVILAEQGYQVTAVDYTEEMLKEAKKKCQALMRTKSAGNGWMPRTWSSHPNSSMWWFLET